MSEAMDWVLCITLPSYHISNIGTFILSKSGNFSYKLNRPRYIFKAFCEELSCLNY